MPDWSALLQRRLAELEAAPAPAPAAPPEAPRPRRARWQDLEQIPWPVGSIGGVQDLPLRRRCRCGQGEALCEWLPFCHRCAEKLS